MNHDFEWKKITFTSGPTLKIWHLRHNCEKSWPDWAKRPFIWAYGTKNLPESGEISQAAFSLFPSVIVCHNITSRILGSKTNTERLLSVKDELLPKRNQRTIRARISVVDGPWLYKFVTVSTKINTSNKCFFLQQIATRWMKLRKKSWKLLMMATTKNILPTTN